MKFNRREFIAGAAGLCATIPVACNAGIVSAFQDDKPGVAPRTRFPNPYTEDGKPVAVVVSGTDFTAMLEKGLELLGGLAIFGTEKPVLIKPNFLLPQPYPLVTDGPAIEAVVAALRKDGFTDISVTELGANPFAPCPVFDYFKMNERGPELGYKVLDLLKDEFVTVKDERWKMMRFCNVAKSMYEAPFIINMPTIKNHSTVDLTCSLKNNMGPIDFDSRMEMHRRHRQPLDKKTQKYEEMVSVAELAHAINPDLSIVDARQVMGGHHNNYRQGHAVDAGKLIISADPVLTDLLAAILLDEKWETFSADIVDPMLQRAAELGLGVARLEDAVIREATV